MYISNCAKISEILHIAKENEKKKELIKFFLLTLYP